jgi:hypothetical protein
MFGSFKLFYRRLNGLVIAIQIPEAVVFQELNLIHDLGGVPAGRIRGVHHHGLDAEAFAQPLTVKALARYVEELVERDYPRIILQLRVALYDSVERYLLGHIIPGHEGHPVEQVLDERGRQSVEEARVEYDALGGPTHGEHQMSRVKLLHRLHMLQNVRIQKHQVRVAKDEGQVARQNATPHAHSRLHHPLELLQVPFALHVLDEPLGVVPVQLKLSSESVHLNRHIHSKEY